MSIAYLYRSLRKVLLGLKGRGIDSAQVLRVFAWLALRTGLDQCRPLRPSEASNGFDLKYAPV